MSHQLVYFMYAGITFISMNLRSVCVSAQLSSRLMSNKASYLPYFNKTMPCPALLTNAVVYAIHDRLVTVK